LVVALVSSRVQACVTVPSSDLFIISFSSQHLHALHITEPVTYTYQIAQMRCNKDMWKYQTIFLLIYSFLEIFPVSKPINKEIHYTK
jgi:hypothetical protein